MLRLIVDSGSTKTDWALMEGERCRARFQTSGMNPSLMADEMLLRLLREELLPLLRSAVAQHQLLNADGEDFLLDVLPKFGELRFYGAGCRVEQEERMVRLLGSTLPADRIVVASDLLGAAHALCGTQEGVVCILGTGSASALYDGARFVQQTPSLGYILGDEGSGTSLGKHLVADVMKAQLPPEICRDFLAHYDLDLPTLIERIYRQPNPNRYLAQFTYFLSAHIEHEAIRMFVEREFEQFFVRNVLAYNRSDLKVNFVGSVAHIFQTQLLQAAQRCGLRVGRILRSPLDALVQPQLPSRH